MKKYYTYLLYPVLFIMGFIVTKLLEAHSYSFIILPFYLVYLPLCSIYVAKKSISKKMFDFPLSMIATLSMVIVLTLYDFFAGNIYSFERIVLSLNNLLMNLEVRIPLLIHFVFIFISTHKIFRSKKKSVYQRIKEDLNQRKSMDEKNEV